MASSSCYATKGRAIRIRAAFLAVVIVAPLFASLINPGQALAADPPSSEATSLINSLKTVPAGSDISDKINYSLTNARWQKAAAYIAYQQNKIRFSGKSLTGTGKGSYFDTIFVVTDKESPDKYWRNITDLHVLMLTLSGVYLEKIDSTTDDTTFDARKGSVNYSYLLALSSLGKLQADWNIYQQKDPNKKSRFFENTTGKVQFTKEGLTAWNAFKDKREILIRDISAAYMSFFVLQKANQVRYWADPNATFTGSVYNNYSFCIDSTSTDNDCTGTDRDGAWRDNNNPDVFIKDATPKRLITLRAEDMTMMGHLGLPGLGQNIGWAAATVGCNDDLFVGSPGTSHIANPGSCFVGKQNKIEYYNRFERNDHRYSDLGVTPKVTNGDDEYIKEILVENRYSEQSVYTSAEGGFANSHAGMGGIPTAKYNAVVASGSISTPDLSSGMNYDETSFKSWKTKYYDPYFLYGATFLDKLIPVVKASGANFTSTVGNEDMPDVPAASGMGRCGKADVNTGLSFSISDTFSYAVCSMVTTIQGWSLTFLEASLNLLGSTADIATIKNGTGDGFFSRAIPSEISLGAQRVITNPGDSWGTVVRNAYNLVLGLLDTIIIIIFIVVALLNIMQIDMNTYVIKKILPGIIMGFIVAHLSMLAVAATLEVATQVSTVFLNAQVIGANKGTGSFKEAIERVGSYGGSPDYPLIDSRENTKPDMNKVFQQGIMNIFVLAAAVMIFILGFLFAVRAIVFYFLIPLAPLAFFSVYFTPASAIWKRWSKTFISWAFMPAVSSFWLALGFIWLSVANPANLKIMNNPDDVTLLSPAYFQLLLAYAFAMVCIYFAMKTPFSMAGEAKMLLDKWNGLGKSAWNNTGGRVLKGAAAEARYLAMDKTLIGVAVRGKKQWDEGTKLRRESAENGPAMRMNKKKAAKAEARAKRIEKNRENATEWAKQIADMEKKIKDKDTSPEEREKLNKRVAELRKDIWAARRQLALDVTRRNLDFKDRVNTMLNSRVLSAQARLDQNKAMEASVKAGVETLMMNENKRYRERADFIKQLEFDTKNAKNSVDLKKAFNFTSALGDLKEQRRRQDARIMQIEDEAGMKKHEETQQAIAAEKFYNDVNDGIIKRSGSALDLMKQKEGNKLASGKLKSDINGKDIENLANEILIPTGGGGANAVYYQRAIERANIARTETDPVKKHAALAAIDEKYRTSHPDLFKNRDSDKANKAITGLGTTHRAITSLAGNPTKTKKLEEAVNYMSQAIGSDFDGIRTQFLNAINGPFPGGTSTERRAQQREALDAALKAYEDTDWAKDFDALRDAPGTSL